MIKLRGIAKVAIGAVAAAALTVPLAAPASAETPPPEAPAGLTCFADMTRADTEFPGTLRAVQYGSLPGSSAGGPGIDAFVNVNPVQHTGLGFNPKAIVKKNGHDSVLYTTSPSGTLYVVDGDDSTAVNKTWGGIRTMTDVVVTDKFDTATGVTYTYAITDQGALMRYTQSKGVANMYGTVQVSPRGWWPLKGFSYWMTKPLSNGDQADVFLGECRRRPPAGVHNPPGDADEMELKGSPIRHVAELRILLHWKLHRQNGQPNPDRPVARNDKDRRRVALLCQQVVPGCLPTVTQGTRVLTGFTNSYSG